MKRRKAIKIAATTAAATMFSSARAAFKDRAPEKKEYRAIATDRFYESASPDDIFPKIFEAGKKSHLSIRLPSSVAQTENLRFVCAEKDRPPVSSLLEMQEPRSVQSYRAVVLLRKGLQG